MRPTGAIPGSSREAGGLPCPAGRSAARLFLAVALAVAGPMAAGAVPGPGSGPEQDRAGPVRDDGLRRQLGRDSFPVPVLLVPGWSDPEEVLAPLEARFIQAGWPPGRVATLGFDDPAGSNREHAGEVAAALRALREATGAGEADIVAHSMGGLAVRRHLVSAGDEGIRRIVFLATPHRGTVAAHLAWGPGGEEMEPGSPFLDSLNAVPPVPEGVEALSVRAVLDLRVLPGESASLPEAPNVRNVEVCCPTHPGLLDDAETFQIVVDFLRGGEGNGASGVEPPVGPGRQGTPIGRWRRRSGS